MPFGKQAQVALKALGGLELKMIATGHGIIWRTHIDKILDCYKKWSAGEVEDRAVVAFDSMWHSTEILARTITEVLRHKKNAALGYRHGHFHEQIFGSRFAHD